MLDMIKKLIEGIVITCLGIILEFYLYYGVTVSEVIEKINQFDTYTKNYLLMVLILVLAILFTYDMLPIHKVYLPLIGALIINFVAIPRMFKILVILCFAVLFIEEIFYEKRNRTQKQEN